MQPAPAWHVLDQQNVAVPTHKQVGPLKGELRKDAFGVFRGAPTNVRHPNLGAASVEPSVLRPFSPNFLAVDVAKHCAYGRQLVQGIGDFERPDVPRMPNFIASFHVLENAIVHVAMGVGEQRDVHASEVLTKPRQMWGLLFEFHLMKWLSLSLLACMWIVSPEGQAQSVYLLPPQDPGRSARKAYDAALDAYRFHEQDLALERVNRAIEKTPGYVLSLIHI